MVPKSRIAVLVGEGGKTRKKIEKLTETKVEIDSKTGEVEVRSKGEGLNFYNALNIIKAIARGFSPEKAFLLSDEEYYLDLIDVSEIVGGSGKEMEIKKGRVIGTRGIARESIEKATGCFISVYGKTIGIIGKVEDMESARKAIEMLLEGAKHTTMLDFLKKKEFESRRFEL